MRTFRKIQSEKLIVKLWSPWLNRVSATMGLVTVIFSVLNAQRKCGSMRYRTM